MTWILIMTTLYIGYSAQTTTQEFGTENACLAAKKIVVGEFNSGVTVAAACVEKGSNK